MAETQIEWTDATWNPVAGCSIVSAGCTNCYAMEMARRLQAMDVEKYRGLTRRSGKRSIWNGVVREDRAALEIPLKWKKPKKIFVNSMSDLFHEAVSDKFIFDVWNVMRATPWHQYQILTKRPERMAAIVRHKIRDVLPNVWLGTSIEDADVIDRANALRTVPATIRFISFEPLIGSVGAINLSGFQWAIVGGESGRSARPIREEWIDEIYDQCAVYGTVFFFKQWGTWGKDNKRRSKKANGRTYRDREWDGMPTQGLAGTGMESRA
jgi:protein gp37